MLGQPPAGLAIAEGGIDLPYGASLDEATPERQTGALLRFQTEEVQVFSAVIPDPMPGGATGIAAYADPLHSFELTLRLEAGARVLCFRRQADDLITESRHLVQTNGPVEMAIHADADAYRFVTVQNGELHEIGQGQARLLSAESCEWFVGVNFALLAFAPTAEAESIARFRGVSCS
jgi:hypothetical protein